VEFVCGERAVGTARKDYETLVESGALFSTHVWEVPACMRKLLDESKAAGKTQHKLLEEIAELRAAQMIAAAKSGSGAGVGRKHVIAEVPPARALAFVKLLAPNLTQTDGIVALLGAGSGQAALVFAQSPEMSNDMGALMKEAMAKLGGRGGGNKDLAQGGVPDPAKLEEAVREAATKIK
jgi:alanyl-tRNA synthetase